MPLPITVHRPEPRPGRPVLVLSPSVGTSAATLWGAALPLLVGDFDVLTWDLPGHAGSAPAATAYDAAELATAVLAAVDGVLDRPGASFHYAGVSFGGSVGLHLLLDHPGRVLAASLLCTGAKIGEAGAWHERADLVEAEGIAVVVDGSRQRWFGPGFTDREPRVAEALLEALRTTEVAGYAHACRALAGFDVRDRLHRIQEPVLAVAGAHDVATPVASLELIAAGVADGRLVVLDDVAHLAPAEAPEAVVRLVLEHHTRADVPG